MLLETDKATLLLRKIVIEILKYKLALTEKLKHIPVLFEQLEVDGKTGAEELTSQ